jgi:uncharacterized damage-inducible protein DinB
MTLNPYARFVEGRDPRAVIAETAAKLAAVAEQLGPANLNTSPAPGKWSPREVLCHLADTELAFAFRLRQTLAEPHHVIQPFDQDQWAKPYAAIPAEAALAAFTAVRAWNLVLLGTVPAEAYSKPVSHPERGAMTFGTLVETMAGHDLNHLRQLEALARQAI